MDDVMPFLENVTGGRDVPRERLEEVAHHYELFGGVSPINAQNRALVDALRLEFATHGIELPIYFGNRNWHPFLADTLREMADDGVERALAFLTSAYSSYSGCRQYREDLFEAQQAVGPRAPEVLRTRVFFNHPGWIEANADHVRQALGHSSSAAAPPSGVHGALDPPRDGAGVPLRGSAARVGAARGGRRRSRRLGARLPEPQWPAAHAVARAGRARPPAGRCCPRRDERRALAHRLRLRSSRGALRPRRRGAGHRGGTRPRARARLERVDPPGLRQDDPRARGGAARAPWRRARRCRPLRREPRRLSRPTAVSPVRGARAPGRARRPVGSSCPALRGAGR